MPTIPRPKKTPREHLARGLMVAAKAFRLRLDRVDGDGISSVHGAPLTSKNLMKKTRFNETRRSGSKNRSHLLYLHTNTRGEISPGLESAIKIAGRCLSVNPLLPEGIPQRTTSIVSTSPSRCFVVKTTNSTPSLLRDIGCVRVRLPIRQRRWRVGASGCAFAQGRTPA
jgi:hypothetical protein